VKVCYLTEHNGEAARITTSRTEPWSTYMMNISAALKADLLTSLDDWERVRSANKGNHEISLLRAFDIVAWNCGRNWRQH
jgi:hypothetical protein